jgi:hypothetical protein
MTEVVFVRQCRCEEYHRTDKERKERGTTEKDDKKPPEDKIINDHTDELDRSDKGW